MLTDKKEVVHRTNEEVVRRTDSEIAKIVEM